MTKNLEKEGVTSDASSNKSNKTTNIDEDCVNKGNQEIDAKLEEEFHRLFGAPVKTSPNKPKLSK